MSFAAAAPAANLNECEWISNEWTKVEIGRSIGRIKKKGKRRARTGKMKTPSNKQNCV